MEAVHQYLGDSTDFAVVDHILEFVSASAHRHGYADAAVLNISAFLAVSLDALVLSNDLLG